MKAIATEKPRSPSTVTVKLDPSGRERIASLAAPKKRTPHYLMKAAILEYIKREEAQQRTIGDRQLFFQKTIAKRGQAFAIWLFDEAGGDRLSVWA